MLQRLQDDLARDIDNLRVIILTANGKVFSAGHDLKELVTHNMCTIKLIFKTASLETNENDCIRKVTAYLR